MDLGLIKPDNELDGYLKQARKSDTKYRWLMIMIDRQKCQMILKNKSNKQQDWQHDYQLFYKQIDRSDNRPFFLLIHLDSNNINWLLIHMSPPQSDVKQKMVAASTKTTLKNSFGTPLITMDLFIEDFDDLSLEKIFHEIQCRQHDKRQIQTLQELEQQKQQELEVMHKIQHCHLGRSGGALHFDCLLDEMAENEIGKFQQKQNQYCCLRFIMSNDYSQVIFDGKLTLTDYPLLAKCWNYQQFEQHDQILLPQNFQPGYIVFRFRHQNPLNEINDNNEPIERFIMISYVPIDNTLPAKLRFSYSVNLNSMIGKLTNKLDNQLKYFEADSLNEVTVKRIFFLLYPSLDMDLSVQKQSNEMAPPLKFDKPIAKGRGPRRMIR